MNILLVDDSQVVREQLLLLLKEIKGISHISQAETPAQAWAIIKSLPIDVLILDIILNEGTGMDLLKIIKENGKKPPLVIALTNYTYDQIRDKCLAAGADYFFDKSIDFEKIPDVLRKFARSQKKGA